MTQEEYNSKMREVALEYAELGNGYNKFCRRLAIADLVIVIVLSVAAVLLGNPLSMIGVPFILWNAYTNVRDGKRRLLECLQLREDTLNRIQS